MKKFFLSAALVFAAMFAVPAMTMADGLSEPIIESPVLSVGQNWAGIYAGGSLGAVDTDQAVNNEGYLLGVFAGYRYTLGNVVLGAEGGYSWINDGNGGNDTATLEAMVGYDGDFWLPYVSAGYGWADNNTEGAVYGIGIDYKMTANTIIGVKASYQDFNTNTTALSARFAFTF